MIWNDYAVKAHIMMLPYILPGVLQHLGASEPSPVLVQFPSDASTGKKPFIVSISCGGTFNLAVSAKNQVDTQTLVCN